MLRDRCKIPISFGGAAISGEGGGYGFGKISEKESLVLLELALDYGIEIFDTAPIYGFGTSEKRIGKAFCKKRDQVFLVSKCGVSWHDSKRVNMTNDPVIAQKMLEQSLRDLQSDYIDLYMIHWPDKKVDIRKTMEVLAKAKEQKKILHIGLCNTFEKDFEKASEIAKVEVVQSEFSFIQNEVREKLFDRFKKDHTSFMSWGTLGKGIITGRVSATRKYDDVDARSWAPWWKKSNYKEQVSKMEKVSLFLKEKGHSGLELALGYNLSFEEISTAICGVRSREQLESLMDALNNRPSQENIERAIEIYNEN